MKRTLAIGLVAIALIGLPATGRAADGAGKQVATGAGSAFGTLVYAPLKASFCILGAIGSGFTYIVDSKTAGKVARASCTGSWVVTPSVVEGKEPIHFVGDTSDTSSGEKTPMAQRRPVHRANSAPGGPPPATTK